MLELPAPLKPFAHHFPEEIRARAERMLARGEVVLITQFRGQVTAAAGTSPVHDVYVHVLGDNIRTGCKCEASRTPGRGCEHQWAVLLKLARETSVFDALDPAAADRLKRWKSTLGAIQERLEDAARDGGVRETARPPLWYVLSVPRYGDHVSVLAGTVKSGKTVQFQQLRRDFREASGAGDEVDRELLLLLAGATASRPLFVPHGQFDVPRQHTARILAEVCASGRLLERIPTTPAHLTPLRWQPEPFRVVLAVSGPREHRAVLTLVRGENAITLPAPGVSAIGTLVLAGGALAPLADPAAAYWVREVMANPLGAIHADELDEFLAMAARTAAGIELEVAEGLGPRVVATTPRPRVVIEAPAGAAQLEARLLFDYDETAVDGDDGHELAYLKETRVLLRRDVPEESRWRAAVEEAGLKLRRLEDGAKHRVVSAKKLSATVSALIARGVLVQAEGIVYRKARRFSSNIETGQNWFAVAGSVDFDGVEAPFPRILRALRKNERLVELGDGSFGLLPDEWLARFHLLDELGTLEGDSLRFRRSQLLMVDELLADATTDDAFARARAELATFDGIAPVEPPAGFSGELRPYQKEGLGWLQFLERFGFGGCLADDMGLGKTVQVLAYLAGRTGTALVVAPRSLTFNWVAEAGRFAPGLKVLAHVGLNRTADPAALLAHDLVITTYGTLRRDVELLARVAFDTVVLDEAQAIKNPDTDAAIAARRLQAVHRIALSGTPVENHLGELVSLMDFLNPGLFGAHPLLARSGVKNRPQDKELAKMLRSVLRPFLLRRTKAAVAPQLPARTEQTLTCDLEADQRALYDELRDHYRAQLLANLTTGQDKLLVLEALLRLRQVACHPGLVDPARAGAPSAKLDLLMDSLAEVLDEGHKVLVFSQFTALLALVRDRLERAGVIHEYLDGKTRDRAARVRRFQEDPTVKAFLISLRAGGLGLNLTAADYVYILDPWWNPAVEAQAIDRAHRIGQDRTVFAYRLVARDTVEERILALQATKRELADAILGEDAGPLARLTREDLEALLG